MSESPEEQPERSPLYDNPALVRAAHGSDELLDLLVKREELFDAGVNQRQESGEISEDHLEKVKDMNRQIKTLREALNLDPYE